MKRQADQLITAIDDSWLQRPLAMGSGKSSCSGFSTRWRTDQADRRFLMADDPNLRQENRQLGWINSKRTANDRCVDTLGTRRQQ